MFSVDTTLSLLITMNLIVALITATGLFGGSASWTFGSTNSTGSGLGSKGAIFQVLTKHFLVHVCLSNSGMHAGGVREAAAPATSPGSPSGCALKRPSASLYNLLLLLCFLQPPCLFIW
jgi:hypothetical protein